MTLKSLVLSDQPGEIVSQAQEILEPVARLHIPAGFEPSDLYSLLDQAEGVLSWGSIRLGEDFFKQAPKLRVISMIGVGVDNIDLASATRYGVIVANAPGSNSQAVAEFAFMLILVLARRFLPAQAAIREKRWPKPDDFTGPELYGKVLGLVGLGHIGKCVAAIAKGFGMRIIAFDPYLPPSQAEQLEVESCSLEQVLAGADILSIHCPLTPETRGMLGKKELAVMKPGAILVNTARAPIVDQDALYEALLSGHLQAAAADVFPKEPPDFLHPIYALDNFIGTPHIASVTHEALIAAQVQAARAVTSVLSGNIPDSIVNPTVVGRLS